MTAAGDALRRTVREQAAKRAAFAAVAMEARLRAAAPQTKEWVHDEPPNPFPPHLALDTYAYEADDDPGLSSAGWPARYAAVGPFFYPQDHDLCIPAGTIVSGPTLHGATLRYHQGQLTTIVLAGGDDLSATPNHPVLTRSGWIPIGLLEEGDEVVRRGLGHRRPDLIPDDRQMPSRVEDVARAFAVTPGVFARCVPVTPVDFHGDGMAGEVCVVWTDGLLMDHDEPSGSEPSGESSLVLSYAAALELTRDSARALRFVSHRNPTDRVVRGLGPPHLLLGGPSRGEQTVGVRSSSRGDSLAQQMLADDQPTHADMLGDCLDGLAGLIEFDKVLHVRQMDFRGHVYNLSTAVNWYEANGILVHNCRCYASPVPRTSSVRLTSITDTTITYTADTTLAGVRNPPRVGNVGLGGQSHTFGPGQAASDTAQDDPATRSRWFRDTVALWPQLLR